VAAGGISLAGCTSGGGGESSGGDITGEQQAIEEWGQRLNEHAREADIDWRQFEGQSLMFGMNVHPFTELMKNFIPYFQELTGINIQFSEFPEDQLWQRLVLDLEGETGLFDGFMGGLWPSSQYHANGWTQNLNEFINDPDLTDQNWLSMGDFPQGVLDSLSYGEDNALTALPFGIEAYGITGYDQPTLEQLGIDPPTDFPSLRDAAKTIHESDETDRVGIASRASATALSTANFATMFRSYDADWIDRTSKEAVLNSPEGIAALELFAELMGDYGPQDIGSFDWYRANTAMGAGDLGMVYHTPVAIGVWEEEQLDRTEWIPPLPGPNGSQVAAPWVWGLGISNYTENAGAAWLFLQWAISQEANLLQSIKAWDGHPTYGWAREGYIFDTPEWNEFGLSDSWVQAHRQGLEMIPSDPPAVPVDVPMNMDIMSEVAVQMNAAVTGQKSAAQALNDAAPRITEHAKRIPSSYL